MLFFIAHPKHGFVRAAYDEPTKSCAFTTSVRSALPFDSFKAADDFAKERKLGSWAILSNCIG